MTSKDTNRQRRKAHIRKSLRGSSEKPRLTVYRSANHIYAQIVDDEKGLTLASASDAKESGGTGLERAAKVGEKLAAAAKKNKVTKVVFDRNGYKFHGRVKALADAARDGGLEF